MADNVQLTSAVVASTGSGTVTDPAHQKVINEFSFGGMANTPVQSAVGNGIPVDAPKLEELLTNILIELRVQTELQYALSWTETEPIEMLREKYKELTKSSL